MGLFDQQVTTDVTSQTSKSAPWNVQQPYLKFLFDQAKKTYGSGGPDYYPDSTVAPFSPMQETGLGMLENRATQGSPVNQAAQGYTTDVLQGDYLNSNPYLDETFDRAAGSVRRNMDSQFARSGRYGSGNHEAIMGESLADLGNRIYGGNYQSERDRQSRTLGFSPNIANQDYTDINQMLQGGGMVQNQAQNILSDDVNRFNYYENRPEQNLQDYMSFIRGDYGGTTESTSQQPMYSNSPAQNALGYGLTGYSVAENIPGLAPYSGLIGGAAGLMGLLS